MGVHNISCNVLLLGYYYGVEVWYLDYCFFTRFTITNY